MSWPSENVSDSISVANVLLGTKPKLFKDHLYSSEPARAEILFTNSLTSGSDSVVDERKSFPLNLSQIMIPSE